MTTRATRERRLVGLLSLALLALVGAVGALVHTDRRASVDTASAAPPDTISRIAIERPERDTIVLERLAGGNGMADPAGGDTASETGHAGDLDGDWHIVAPCALDALGARVGPLLDALAGSALDYPAGEVDLDAAGLVRPLAVVRLDGTSVALGGTDLGGERRYALQGNRVALVPEWTLSLVGGGLSALAEPAPFATAPTRLRRLAAPPGAASDPASGAASDTGSGIASATETGERAATVDLEAPDAPPLGAAAAELDPRPWGDLAASQVVVWPVADAPPTTRTARLEATLASGETQVLELVGNASWNALLSEDGACARLFADSDLPPDAYR